MNYSSNFKQVTDSILDVINKQEQMQALGMAKDREIGVEVMFFAHGIVAIEPTLSCPGESIEVGDEVIDPQTVIDFLISCSTAFREDYDAVADTTRKTPIIRINKKTG